MMLFMLLNNMMKNANEVGVTPYVIKDVIDTC